MSLYTVDVNDEVLPLRESVTKLRDARKDRCLIFVVFIDGRCCHDVLRNDSSLPAIIVMIIVKT